MRAQTFFVLLAALALAGGATGSGGSENTGRTNALATAGPGHSKTLAVAWGSSLAGVHLPRSGARFLSADRLAFRTAGSGSCPALPTRLTITSPNSVTVRITVFNPNGPPCTADLRVTTVEFAIDPKRIDVRRQLSLRLIYEPGGRGTTLIAKPLR